MQLTTGTELQNGKFRIISVLGQGGFGITYLAQQERPNRKVAIKEFFMKEYCNRDSNTSHVSVGSIGSKDLVERFKQKFLKEADLIASFDNANIIRIYDVFEENGTAYYVMEYLEGKSLKALVDENGALPEDVAVKYIRQVAEALKEVHENNLLHLDVKPANIMLGKRGDAVLIDFGISKHYDEEGAQTSSAGVGISEGYAPIEQYEAGALKTFTPVTDIYALGATLFFLLTGTRPPKASEVMNVGLPALPGNVSPAVRNAVETAMQPATAKRPQSIGEFLRLVESGESKDESGKMKDATSIFGNASSDRSSAASQNVMPLGSQKASVAKEQKSIFGNASSDRSSAASQNVMPLGSQKASENSFDEVKVEGVEAVAEGDETIFGNDDIDKTKFSKSPTVQGRDVAEQEDNPDNKPKESKSVPKWFWISLALFIAFCCFIIGLNDTETINGHEYVDLGLPSGLKWATCNVGADNPEEYGNYYAWGETYTKDEYTDKFSYIEGDISGNPTYDVAREKWGSTWRLPTKAEFDELRNENNCKWTWTEQNGVEGYKVTSRKNGNSIFLPAAGWRDGTSLDGQSRSGLYWSSTPRENDSYRACGLYFYCGVHDTNWYRRYYGRSVRPVSQ